MGNIRVRGCVVGVGYRWWVGGRVGNMRVRVGVVGRMCGGSWVQRVGWRMHVRGWAGG